MADISTELARILSAIYGEDVRGSIHDAIEKINDVSEVVLTTGTDVTSPSSSSTGFYDGSLYLNTDTFELWKCTGVNTWASQGTLKGEAGDDGNGIVSIAKTATSGLVDTYTITYTDGNTDTFTVTNGKDGANGNKWYRGTGIAGKSSTPTVYTGSGVADANSGDMFLNPLEGAVYSCVTGGIPTVATWQYEMTLSGGSGGTPDYPDLTNKPSINGHTLLGNQTGADLGLANSSDIPTVDQTYSATSSNAQSGKAVAQAIASVPSGGMLPYLYIDSEAGATVTVNQPDGTVITPTAAGSGHWECELPGGYGTYVIHSVLSGQGDATLSLAVDTVKEYHVTDTHYDFTINVTAPSGSSIRITGGGETYTGTGTGSSQAFAVHTASTTYTVTATQIMDGNTKTDEATVTSASTSGGSTNVTLSIEFGTINVSVAADFVTAGSTITCVKAGVNTISKAAASTLTFRVPETGEYTISGSVGGTPYSTTATVTSLSTPESVSLATKAPMYPFETATDAQLAAMLDSYYNGYYDTTEIETLKSTYMPIGAKRTIHLSAMSAYSPLTDVHHADNYDVVIIGHEHDNLKTPSSSGKTKALLTLQLDRILYKNTTDETYTSDYPAVEDEGGYMNSTATNVGGWTNCARRSWCNNIFINALPTDIKSLVKTVNKLTSAGNQSSTIETTEDDIFLLSEIEVFGRLNYSKAGEGSQYEYFTTASNINKKPSYKTYVNAYWWERSPHESNVTAFCKAHANGNPNYDTATDPYGLAPAFCI